MPQFKSYTVIYKKLDNTILRTVYNIPTEKILQVGQSITVQNQTYTSLRTHFDNTYGVATVFVQ